MTTVWFLAGWALRSSILIAGGALLLRALRVKDAEIRLACWTALLCGSLAIPALTLVLPRLSIPMAANAALQPAAVPLSSPPAVEAAPTAASGQSPRRPIGFDWVTAGLAIYVLVAGALLLRLAVGLAKTRRLLRASLATGRETDGIEIRESKRLAAPAALGIVRPAIVLPAGWREWDGGKLDAVLAHERSHIRRRDPAVQLLSAIHRALVWHSPLSWLLDRRIVRLAEEASDDAAVAATRDRASYAEVLLGFLQHGVRREGWQGVAMARYGKPEERIHRILDGAGLSRGVSRWSAAAILAVASPLAYLAAAANPQAAPEPAAPALAAKPVATAAPQKPAAPAQATPAQAAPATPIRRYMIFDNDSTSGSWDSADPMDDAALRSKFGRHFAWFRRNGQEYVITDAGVLGELRAAMAPQQQVNRMQSAVNSQQSVVNAHQANVNQAQSGVNAMQAVVNRRQDLINKLQAAKGDAELIQRLEEALAELRSEKDKGVGQDAVNRKQSEVNAMQQQVNAEQAKVNEQQHRVNDEQQRVSAEFSRRIQEIFQSALERGLAQPLL